MPNRFLASFTPFLLKHAKEPVCKTIIGENFRNPFRYYVLNYSVYKSGVKVSFTGSIAHTFSDHLVEIAEIWTLGLKKMCSTLWKTS